MNRPIGLRQIGALEKRRRRKHDVGIWDGVGEDLLEHDREEILSLQAASGLIFTRPLRSSQVTIGVFARVGASTRRTPVTQAE